MNRVKFLLVIVFLISIFSNNAFGAEVTGMGINNEQPISIGEKIYEKIASVGDMAGGQYIWMMQAEQYIYAGIENNNIKIDFIVSESADNSPMTKRKRTLSLPLNNKKQTLLKVNSFSQPPKMDLLITVIDDFNRIKVEKFKD